MCAGRAKDEPFIASMGIYVAKASAIRELLRSHFPEARLLPTVAAACTLWPQSWVTQQAVQNFHLLSAVPEPQQSCQSKATDRTFSGRVAACSVLSELRSK